MPWNKRSLEGGIGAFTLVEMLLVLVLLATLTGTMAVSLGGRQDRHAIRVCAKDLATAIRFCAAQARLKGQSHRVAFYEGASAYRVEAADAVQGDDFVPVYGQAGRKRTLVKGVEVTAISTEDRELDVDDLTDVLTFRPKGNNFHGKIELRNRKDEAITIEVLPTTAQVHID